MLRGARNLASPAADTHPDDHLDAAIEVRSSIPSTPPSPGPVRGDGPSAVSGSRTAAAVATELEPDLAEPPEIDFDRPGPPRITGRSAAGPPSPPRPLHPPDPGRDEIEIRPLTAELGIHPESIPPPGGDVAPPGVPDDDPPRQPAPRWTGFAASFDDPADRPDPAGADLPTDPSLTVDPGAPAEPEVAPVPPEVAPASPDRAQARYIAAVRRSTDPENRPPSDASPDRAPAHPAPVEYPPFVLPRRAPAGFDDDWTLIPPAGSRAPTVIAAGMLFLGGLGIGIATTLLATENDGPPASAPTAAKATPPQPAAPAPGTPVALVPQAFAIDPYGGDGEHQAQARLAVDGNPATAWTTQRYATGALGKPGVGLAVTGVRPAAARRITIRTPTPGFRAAIYGAPGGRPAPGSPRAGWVRLAGASTVRSGVPIRLAASPRMRHWLVWIVALAPGRKSAEIAEIGLRR